MGPAAIVADFNRFNRFLFKLYLGVKQLVATFGDWLVFERFFADLAAARKGNATTAPCVKSASFGSTLRITWQQWVSPDLTCPPKDALGAALITDAQTLREVAGIGAAPLRQGPEIQPPD